MSTTLSKRKSTVRFAYVVFNSISVYLFVITFAIKSKYANYKSHWNILVFCDQWNMMSDLNMSHEKMSYFVSFLLFGLTVVIKLRSFDFESHWNVLIFFDKKNIVLILNMFQGKIFDFVSSPLFRFTLVIKLTNFDFETHWNILICFDEKRYGVGFKYVSRKNVWFCFISIA